MHTREYRQRPGKSRRASAKLAVSKMDDVDPEEAKKMAEELAEKGGYLSFVVKSKLRTIFPEEFPEKRRKLESDHPDEEAKAESP